MTFELTARAHLLDPQVGDDESESSVNKLLIDAVHLSMVEQVIGPIPESWAREGRFYGTLYEEGELIRRNEEELGSVFELLVRHRVPEAEAAELTDFLEPMLSIIPDQRPSAEEMLQAAWLHQIC
jgi:serine/threonine protein kinase